jgi:hypothetical protein
VQPPVPLQPPDQPPNDEPAVGDAVSVTFVPLAKLFEHAPGQLIAPSPITVPDPLPASETVRVSDARGIAVNVAVTFLAELIATVQLPVPLHPPPDQPANRDPEAGLAANVMFCPRGSGFEHVPGQEMPPPLTRPLPVPEMEVVSRKELPVGLVVVHDRYVRVAVTLRPWLGLAVIESAIVPLGSPAILMLLVIWERASVLNTRPLTLIVTLTHRTPAGRLRWIVTLRPLTHCLAEGKLNADPGEMDTRLRAALAIAGPSARRENGQASSEEAVAAAW